MLAAQHSAKDLWEIFVTPFSDHSFHCLSPQIIVESMTLNSNICFLDSFRLLLFMNASLLDQRKNIIPRKRIQVTVVLTSPFSQESQCCIACFPMPGILKQTYSRQTHTSLMSDICLNIFIWFYDYLLWKGKSGISHSTLDECRSSLLSTWRSDKYVIMSNRSQQEEERGFLLFEVHSCDLNKVIT